MEGRVGHWCPQCWRMAHVSVARRLANRSSPERRGARNMKIKKLRRFAAVLGMLPLLSFEPVLAQTTANSAVRLETFSKLPDWSGLWRLKGSPGLLDVENGRAFVPGNRDHPPYNPEWEA